jgi:glycosyltransferase involved in cell wall biosynthesis
MKADEPVHPLVSVIIPCFNEEKFIGHLLENIISQDYPRERLEVFIIDGMSSDRTNTIIREYSRKYPFIQILQNEKRYVPFALNQGIRKAGGEVIIRMDAHSQYPPDYFSRLVKYLYELNADNVGGSWITMPGNDTLKSVAIAAALSSPFGVGNAHYRLNIKSIRKVDTVPFGCYRREVFNRIGMFDEELLRNQDYAFNTRLIKSGGKIFLVPDIKIHYYARTSVKSIWSMFFQYGLFNPLLNRKSGIPLSIRKFIPPAFVLFFLFTAIGGIFFKPVLLAGIAGLSIYLITNLIFSVRIVLKHSKPGLLFYLPWLFFVFHTSYGTGHLVGFLRFGVLRQKKSGVRETRM